MQKEHLAYSFSWSLDIVSKFFAVVLLVTSIFLPLGPLFASEEIAPVEVSQDEVVVEAPSDDVSLESETVVQSDVPVSDATEPQVDVVEPLPLVDSDTDVVDESVSELIQIDETQEHSIVSEDVVRDTDPSSTIDPIIGTTTSTTTEDVQDMQLLEVASTTIAETILPVATVSTTPDVSSSTLGVDNENVEITAPEVDTTVQSDVSVTTVAVNDSNYFSFSKNSCVTMGEGSFYCMTPVATTTEKVTHTDRVFTAPDADGDKEIFIEKGGELSQMTFNTVDDDAPMYDPESDTLVWHRLIDGRYQIVSYNLQEQEEVLTNDRYNNMEPYRSGTTLVWQAWIGNDWEILLMDMNSDEVIMLTDNTKQDIAPSVKDNHVVWQTNSNGTWEMNVYDIKTKKTEVIQGSSGNGAIENPRFVLVYDSKSETGDIETKGYDLERGEIIDLAATPAPIPEEIPDPEQTGEKRALISTSLQLKKGENDDATSTPSGDDLNTSDDLVITSMDSASTTSESIRDMDTHDLYVDNGTTTTLEQSIPDLIIPAFNEVPQEALHTQLLIVPMD